MPRDLYSWDRHAVPNIFEDEEKNQPIVNINHLGPPSSAHTSASYHGIVVYVKEFNLQSPNNTERPAKNCY